MSRIYKTFKNQQGQALVSLLVFMVIAVVITSSAVTVIIINSFSSSSVSLSNMAFAVAESGVENALIRLLRDPNYTGETLPVDQGSAIITVSGSNPLTITSEGHVGRFVRKIQAQAQNTNSKITLTSWKEIF